MKRFCVLLLSLTLIVLSFVTCGYSFFLYSSENESVDLDVSGVNALFDEKNTDEYYRVYFFASPYYATGAEIDGETLTDPLKIADHENNPYNLDEEYSLVGSALSGSNIKYANAKFSDNNYHYISYKKNNRGVLDGSPDSLELFSKKDYTGYIRANEDVNIHRQTSTYVSVTVKESISVEYLSGIVAETEFKDNFGFGPEFIGWTYDKATTCARTMYNGARYYSDNTMKRGDRRGYSMRGDPSYQIGNFGCQGEIDQITSMTSLKTLDKTTLDGSLVGDRVIYLYPVFIAKNYSADKTLNGVTTPILKFRVNSDNTFGQDGMYCYEYNQSYEIDYSKNRYTVGFFQKQLNEEKNNVNYYIDNIYIGDGKMQLDVCPSSGNSQWGSYWTTVITSEELEKIGLERGFYNVDATFVQFSDAYDGSSYETVLRDLIRRYEDTDQYVKTYSSLEVEATGVVEMTLDRTKTNGAKKDAYFVIGFKKVETFRLVGDGLNGSITNYYAPGYKELQLTAQLGDSVQYIIGRVYLSAGNEVSILTEYADGTSPDRLGYTISGMESGLDEIEQNFDLQFTGVGASGSGRDIVVENNVLKVNRSQVYTLIFAVDYVQGRPSNVSVAFIQSDKQYSFIVLNQPPEQAFFVDKNALSDQIWVKCDEYANSYLTLETILTDVHAKTSGASVVSVNDLFVNYPDKKLIDTATGAELSYELFRDGVFCLNRNYVVYLA